MKTQSIMVLGLIAAASLISVVAFSENTTQYAVVPNIQQAVQMMGHLEMIATDSDGNIKQYVQTDNSIQVQGANCIINALFGAQSSASGGALCIGSSGTFDTIEVGIGTGQNLDSTGVQTTAGDVDVNPNSGSIVILDSTTGGNNAAGQGANATLSVVFTQGGAGNTITEAVLTNGTAGNALAYKDFGDIVLANGDSLTVNWTVSVLENSS